jgi:NitT/TauT family transport system ATP-binding protein
VKKYSKETTMNNITLQNITKSYNGKKVLDNISLTIKSGATTCIMAPSGEGKTTLLRILMGLEAADSGSISGLNGLRKSAVFQEDRLCENMTPIANIKLTNPKLTTQMITQSLASFGLSDCEHQRTSELSGGMKRRVAILRALLAEYDILFLDEPFKGLDLDTKSSVISQILRLTEGKTVILVTHDESEANMMNAHTIKFAFQ